MKRMDRVCVAGAGSLLKPSWEASMKSNRRSLIQDEHADRAMLFHENGPAGTDDDSPSTVSVLWAVVLRNQSRRSLEPVYVQVPGSISTCLLYTSPSPRDS